MNTEPSNVAPLNAEQMDAERLNAEQNRALRELIARARAEDGQPPFSDQSLVELSTGARELLEIDGLAVALATETEAEFVVDPDARGHGLGTRMLEALIARSPEGLLVWAHGDHPAARALARSHGLEAVRELLQLRAQVVAPVGQPSAGQMKEISTSNGPQRVLSDDLAQYLLHLTEGTPSESYTLSPFRPGTDDAGWLALNARAFANHPEQGRVSQADLDELKRQPWFEADDFLLLHTGGDLVGYCWLKIEDNIGEFYVVGVDPERQGAGLGRRLVEAGLARLAERGIREAHLYVEADNAPALRLYRSYGFQQHTIDVQYRWNTGS